MTGSKNSAILFLLSGILLIVQAGVSLALFDDTLSAFAAGGFAFTMFLVMFMAYRGRLSAVIEQTVIESPSYSGSGGYRTVYTRDTGERVQLTPCCGICGGILIIIVALMIVEPLWEMIGDLTWLVMSPSLVAGIVAILASIVFVMEYKGPYTGYA